MTTWKKSGTSRWLALLRQRCPRCCKGRIFSGLVSMHHSCPSCELPFEREEGYFLGAMYFSYLLGALFMGGFTFLGHLLFPQVNLNWIILAAGILFVPFMPLTFRYSRVIWIFFDRWAWPTASGPHDADSLS